LGWGISPSIARKLINAGVSGIDISGAGGTSWTQVERFRLSKEKDIRVAEEFRDWGIPSGKALFEIGECKLDSVIIASGGLKSGMDIAKSVALGAQLAGMAGVILKKAVSSIDDLFVEIEILERVFRIAMFGTGSGNILQFQDSKIYKVGN
jgi:isopentenyl-diphosphate delta-isomerase